MTGPMNTTKGTKPRVATVGVPDFNLCALVLPAADPGSGTGRAEA
jgi:hypothetical protein